MGRILKALHRAQLWSKAFVLKFVVDLVGPQIAALALQRSMWLPCLISGLLLIRSFPIVWLIPETFTLDDTTETPKAVTYITMVSDLSSYKALPTDWRILVTMAIAFHSQFRYILEIVLLSYTSVRFGLTIN